MRCNPVPGELCCDLCTARANGTVPALVKRFICTQQPLAEKGHNRARVQAGYESGEREDDLKLQLCHWRRQKTMELFPGGDHPPTAILSDERIEAIARVAHRCKIIDAFSLEFESKWGFSSLFGEEILTILARCFPVTVPTTPTKPLARPVLTDFSNAPPAAKRSHCAPESRECSGCGEVGHQRNNSSCKNFRHCM